MDRRLRTLRLIFRTTSMSSGTGCRQGATFLRRYDGWIFQRWMAERGRWAFQPLLTVSPRKLSVVTWSRVWSRCSIPIHHGYRPGKSAMTPCVKLGSAAGATTGCRCPDWQLCHGGGRTSGAVDREVHARIWERPGVKLLRALDTSVVSLMSADESLSPRRI